MEKIVIRGGGVKAIDLSKQQVYIAPYKYNLAIQLQSDDVTDTATLKYAVNVDDTLSISQWATATDSNGDDITIAVGTSQAVENIGNVTQGLTFALYFTKTTGTVNVAVNSL